MQPMKRYIYIPIILSLLLFTLPLSVYDHAERLPGVRIIGHITRPEQGCILVGRDGGEVPLQAQGWQGR